MELWLSLFASVVCVGATTAVIYKFYSRISHPQVLQKNGRTKADFVLDAIAFMIQNDPFHGFKSKAACSAGITKGLPNIS